jgi:ABC-type multidrug transport system fused ATPase/permease subunit
MGTQFFWFFDLLVTAILLAVVYKGVRQGFAAGLVRVVGFFLSFALALTLSVPITNAIYDNFVRPGITEQVVYNDDRLETASAFSTLRNTDMSEATIDGKSMEEYKLLLKHDSAGKISLDLTDVDLSRTGIRDGNLNFFGLDAKSDFGKMNLGKIDINISQLSSNNIEDIVLARAVSMQIAEKSRSNHEKLDTILTDTVPGYSKAASGSTDMLSALLISIINSDTESLETVINDKLVKPVVTAPVRVLIFALLFAVVSIIVSIAAKTMRLVNQIPIIGRLNSFLGGVLGVVQAVIVLFIVCLSVSMIIAVTSNNIIFINTMTIDETLIFKYIYYLSF